jgi:hypothetical protein
MNYIIIICLSIGILHFVLYYLNIDPFELSSKPKQIDYMNGISNNGISNNGTSNNGTSNNGTSNNGTSNNWTSNNGISNNGTSNNTYAKDIEESINELKKLNEYIDNESRPITQC